MRLLGYFFAAAAIALLLVIGLNWWVDPLGQFYDGGALDDATATAPPCVISDDLIGTGSWLQFKEDVFRTQRPRTIAVGSSRVLKIHSRPGERGFANLGMPGTGIETLGPVFQRLHRRQPGPLTVYLGLELFWLNPAWNPNVSFGSSLLGTLRYLLARQNLETSLRLVADSPSVLVHRWQRDRIGGRCVIDRGSRVAEGKKDAWAADGSFEYRFELVPGVRKAPADEYTRDLVRFQGPYYRDWHELDPRRLRLLDEALALARRYGWRVVGFAPPYSPRYLRRLSTAPETAPFWREYGRVVPAIFRRHGFRFLDLRDVRDVPCAPTAFEDDGWHPDGPCAMRVRSRLDAALG